jgi:hypothetical protein
MTEVGCWMHARRYFYKALESDEPHMGPALHLIARLYAHWWALITVRCSSLNVQTAAPRELRSLTCG